jgi:hypothetical protein
MEKYIELYPDHGGHKFLNSILYAMKGEQEKTFALYAEGNLPIFIYLGNAEETIKRLKKNFIYSIEQERSMFLWLKNSPIFNFLRSDPRFQEIVTKHKELYEANLHRYGDVEL